MYIIRWRGYVLDFMEGKPARLRVLVSQQTNNITIKPFNFNSIVWICELSDGLIALHVFWRQSAEKNTTRRCCVHEF